MDLSWATGNRWRLLYSPDFEAAVADKQTPYGVAEADEPYRFVWDITRHVRPGGNELAITHLKVLEQPEGTHGPAQCDGGGGQPHRGAPRRGRDACPTGPLPTYVAAGPQPVPIAAAARDATIHLTIGDQALVVRTRVSLPGGQWREALDEGELSWDAGACRVSRVVTIGMPCPRCRPRSPTPPMLSLG